MQMHELRSQTVLPHHAAIPNKCGDHLRQRKAFLDYYPAPSHASLDQVLLCVLVEPF
jgi:hypothetical protein